MFKKIMMFPAACALYAAIQTPASAAKDDTTIASVSTKDSATTSDTTSTKATSSTKDSATTSDTTSTKATSSLSADGDKAAKSSTASQFNNRAAKLDCNQCTAEAGIDITKKIDFFKSCSDCPGTESYDTGLSLFLTKRCGSVKGKDFDSFCKYAAKMLSKAGFELYVLAKKGDKDAQSAVAAFNQLDVENAGVVSEKGGIGTNHAANFDCNTCTAELALAAKVDEIGLQKCSDCQGEEVYDLGVNGFEKEKCIAVKGTEFSKKCKLYAKMIAKSVVAAAKLAVGKINVKEIAQVITDKLKALDAKDFQ
jgi:hypothetical protein